MSSLAAPSPLSFMARLSPNTLYFDPATPAIPEHPRLIVLLTWMDARDAHIAKYVTQHRVLFPSSRIMVMKSWLQLYLRPALRKRYLLPGVDAINTSCAAAKDSNGVGTQLLVHVFSNGGISTAVSLLAIAPLPRHVLLLDSCPGYYSWARSQHVLAISLPLPVVYVLLAASWLAFVPWGRTPPMDRNAAVLNDEAVRDREAGRTYLYGTGDEAVFWRDVERHAEEARATGPEVRMEKFEGGKHVSHIRIDGQRYWNVVKESWEART